MYGNPRTIELGRDMRHRAAVRMMHRSAHVRDRGTKSARERTGTKLAGKAKCRRGRVRPTAYRTPEGKAHAMRPSAALRALRGIVLACLFAALGIAGVFGVKGYALYQEAAASLSLDDMAASIASAPGFTPLDSLPQTYLDAVVAVEDHRFYDHPGFDVVATARALVNDIRAGAIVEGGSTITQQLAKNEFFTQEQTLERKIAEVFMAFDIERRFSKKEILELYVNSIYFGSGYYGIGQAAQGYFGKNADELYGFEATLLAGTPNAPSAYAPTESPDLALRRQRQVLDKMVERGYLAGDEARAIARSGSLPDGASAASLDLAA